MNKGIFSFPFQKHIPMPTATISAISNATGSSDLSAFKIYLLPNVEESHAVKRGARNGIETSDWLGLFFVYLKLIKCCHIPVI